LFLGFTLIEVVIAIVLLGIVAAITTAFIVRPVEGYRDLARRTALVDAAESALRRMQRDIRTALPNSVRVTNTASGFALELMPVVDGGRYSDSGANRLQFTGGGSNTFEMEHCFRNTALPTTPGLRFVVNNLGTTGDNVYDDASLGVGSTSVITPTAMTISITSATCPTSGFHNVVFRVAGVATNHKFRQASPNDRLYGVTTPASYLCDTSAATLTRYYGYAISASQYTTAAAFSAAANASSALVADRVSGCSVTTTTSQILDVGLATLTLSVAEEGEQVSLVVQTMMDNSR
jgi:MSHA biogenesis protein MshO